MFDRSAARFVGIVTELADPVVDVLSHGEMEDWLAVQGRESMRSLSQDQLDLRALREVRRSDVVAAGPGVSGTRVGKG